MNFISRCVNAKKYPLLAVGIRAREAGRVLFFLKQVPE